MRLIFAIVSTTMFLTSVATNAWAGLRFEGYMILTEASNCVYMRAGEETISTFTPANVGGNGNTSGLTSLMNHEGAGYTKSVGNFSSAFSPVFGVGIGTNAWSYTNAAVRITFKAPLTIAPTTEFVTLKGQIKNPRSDPSVGGNPCIVTFRAAYVRQ